MGVCRECKDDSDELVSIKVKGRARKVCPDCAERLAEELEVAAEGEAVMRDMMGFKGRW